MKDDDVLWVWRCLMYPAFPLAIGMSLAGCDGRYNHILAIVMFTSLAIGCWYRRLETLRRQQNKDDDQP